MFQCLLLLILFFLTGFAGLVHSADSASDAPESPRDTTAVFKAADSYEKALQVWKTPEDINGRIRKGSFSYR